MWESFMSNFYAQYPASASAGANPSVSPNGTPIPTDSTLVAGENNLGNQQPLQIDAVGNLLVSISAFPIEPLLTSDAADGIVNTSAPAEAIQVAGADGSNILRPILTDATGKVSTNVTNITGTVSLPTGASTSANQTTLGSQTTKINDGTRTATIKAASTAAVATDTALVVAVSPNNSVAITAAALPLPAGAATSANQTNGTQTSIVTQTTAANLNATIVGTTAAGSGSATNLITVQGNASGTPVPVSGTITTSNSANGATNNAAPAQATQIGGTDGVNLRALSVNPSGQLNLNNISGTISLPTGASTSANQTNGSQTTKIAGTLQANAPVYNIYSSTNITTAAYVQLVASTSNAINDIHIFDSSGQAMILATGGAGSEVDQVYVQPGGDIYTLTIPAGTRVAYKALTANATTGYLIMSFLQ